MIPDPPNPKSSTRPTLHAEPTRTLHHPEAANSLFWRVVNMLGVVAPVILGVAFIFFLLRFYGASDMPAKPHPAASPVDVTAQPASSAAASPASDAIAPAAASSRAVVAPTPLPSGNAPAPHPEAAAATIGKPEPTPARHPASGGFEGRAQPGQPAPPPPVPSEPVAVASELAQSMRISGESPRYPSIAQAAGVQGTVTVEETISRTGTVEDVRALSGPPLLQAAALAAVRTWRYRPYILRGHPAACHTQVDIAFRITPPAQGQNAGPDEAGRPQEPR